MNSNRIVRFPYVEPRKVFCFLSANFRISEIENLMDTSGFSFPPFGKTQGSPRVEYMNTHHSPSSKCENL